MTARLFVFVIAAACAGAGATKRETILERAAVLAEFPAGQLPDATPEVLRQAGQIAEGTVFFYGRTPVKVGLKDIDWTGSHIRHQEWPAQLNRFFHLRQLAAAYRSTRQERFAQAARTYIEDWIRGDPYETATAFRRGDSSLNMSIRLGSSVQGGWGGTLPVFLASPSFDSAFVERMLASVGRQADFLSRRLTATGNWRIAELDALVFTSLRFPFLPNAPALLRTGIAGMRNALATQFLPDGVHIERTPGYADWMTQVAANYLRLPKLFPGVDAAVDAERLVRALDYGAQSELFGVNDATAPHRDPPALSRLAMRAGVLKRLGLEAPAQPPLEQVFPDAGQVFLRSSWNPGADYIAFDASTWGGGHSHLSRLSFAFRSKGRMLVADPGILNYEMSDPLGPYGKSTEAHSTLNVNGGNQSGADARLLRTAFTSDTALLQARYQGGYWKGRYEWSFRNGRDTGTFGDHERILFWVKGEYLLALDSMTTDPGAEIRNCWQLGPMDRGSQDGASFTWWSENPDGNLLLQLMAPPAETLMQVFEGSREPLRGWVGRHGNDAVPAPLVEFRYPARRQGPVLSAVLLAAFAGKARPSYTLKRMDSFRGALHHLELGLPDGSTDVIAWSSGLALPVDDGRPFLSDGPFVWCRNSHGKPAKCFLVDGSYLRYDGVSLHEASRRTTALHKPVN
jgi:hypothetical protein